MSEHAVVNCRPTLSPTQPRPASSATSLLPARGNVCSSPSLAPDTHLLSYPLCLPEVWGPFPFPGPSVLPGSPGHFRTPLVKNRGSWGGPKGWFSALPGGRLREGQILLVFATCPGGWSPHLKRWGRSHEHSPVGPMPWSSPSARPASDFSPAAPGGSRPEPSVAPPFSVLITNLSCLFFLKSHCLVRRHELSDRGLGVALCSGSREKPVLQ